MDRLFLGFQVKLLLSLLFAGALAIKIVMPRVDRQIARNAEESMNVPLSLMAEALAEEQVRQPGPSQLLAKVKRRLAMPVVLLARNNLELPSGSLDLDRLDRGEVVVKSGRGPHAVLYVRVGSTDQVMRVGPLNPVRPLSQGRGLMLLLFGLAGLSLGVYLLVRPLRRRLGALSRAAESFGRGDLKTRAEVDSPDAIGNVATAFNGMAQQIQRLIAAQQELLRMVSHELRTPLQRIHFALEKVRSATTDEQRHDGLRRVERDLRELDSLLDELLTYVRLEHEPSPQRDPVNLHALVEQLLETQSEQEHEVTLDVVAAPDFLPQVVVNARLIRRALGNLIENAVRNAAAHVEVKLTRAAQTIQIDVEDDGPGVPLAERARIFEPFQRLDSEPHRGGAGCGLGLAIVRRIAEHHHGSVAVDTSSLGGARFRLTLPLHA